MKYLHKVHQLLINLFVVLQHIYNVRINAHACCNNPDGVPHIIKFTFSQVDRLPSIAVFKENLLQSSLR